MTASGGRVGDWTNDSSGVRNRRPGGTDRGSALARIGENFELTGPHAEGATCEVFKGHHVSLDVAIAVKILRPELATDPSFLERMRIEAQVLTRLRSPHVVRCFDRGFTLDGRPFTILEFLRGETLETLLSKLKRFDELSTIEIGLELLEALAATHAHGVVHRDVSLHNLIVHRTELEPAVVKLIDYGFAWIMPDAPESAPEPARPAERDRTVGTPRFMAPEVARGCGDIDARADLYSTGVILYSLLAGRDPFADLRDTQSVLDAQANRSVPPLSRDVPGASPELTSVVMRLLEKDRARRFSSATETARALRAAREAIRAQARRRLSIPPLSSGPTLQPGDRCGPYRVTRLIDGGGFSEVYEAEPTEASPQRRVALRILKPGFAITADARKRFLDETKALAAVRHQNIVTVHQAGEHQGRLWLSMELVEGFTLRQHLQRERGFSPARAIKIAYGVAHALGQLHRLGLVHGNLRPEYVIVTPAGEARLQYAAPTSLIATPERRASWETGAPLPYASPETFTGRPLDERSDLYSWGMVFFEMLTGHSCASAESAHSSRASWRAVLGVLHDPIPERRHVAPHLPEPLWRVLVSATEKRADLRPRFIAEVCSALDEACNGLLPVQPLAVTQEYALGINGEVVVLVWRARPSEPAAREARRLVRGVESQLAVALVVIEQEAMVSELETNAELAELGAELARRAAGVAVVCQTNASGRAGTRRALVEAGFLPPDTLHCGAFTSVRTALDWLGRYHSKVAGLSDLGGVVSHLRRMSPPRSTNELSSHPLEAMSSVVCRPLPNERRLLDARCVIRARDAHLCVATYDAAMINIWYGIVTLERLAIMRECTRAFILERRELPVCIVTIVEAQSPAPNESVRFEVGSYYRTFSPHAKEQIVVAEGGLLRKSLVRSVGTALSRLTAEKRPFTFVDTVREAAMLISPHLSPDCGEVDGLVHAIEFLRARSRDQPLYRNASTSRV